MGSQRIKLPSIPSPIVIALILTIALLVPVVVVLLTARNPLYGQVFGRGDANLPSPAGKVAYIRSVPENGGIHDALYAVDVNSDQVLEGHLLVGRGDYAMENSMAIAPNGKLFLLRCLRGGGQRPYADRGLLILDPNNGWQSNEPAMADDGVAVAVSAQGKAFVARSGLGPDWSFNIDVYDSSDERLKATEKVTGPVMAMLASPDGRVYVSHSGSMDPERSHKAGIRVLDGGNPAMIADIPLTRGGLSGLTFALDGLLYGTVRQAPPLVGTSFAPDRGTNKIGLLLGIDPERQQIVSEMEVPWGAKGLAITPEGKAYILHRNPDQGGQPSEVSVYDLKERKLIKVLPIGRNGTFIKQVSPTKVYAATSGINEEKGKVWVIDIPSDEIVTSLQVGERPSAIAMIPLVQP